ncbi:protein translocase subunit SecD [Sulfurihydrogenibium azorense]|jgi:preprotein translocase subunit SecD|uniref:protein translocase subunit SecD n=1 Tax=Sulfurihydrogenibium azorense TaxID=309806 RepID=UPI0005A2BE9E|nr:protein translocase subunit SecD [Sulfurihydrogenibium azorense]
MGLKVDAKIKLLVIFLVLVGSIYVMMTKTPKLGLDLQGGISITLKVDIDKVIKDQYLNVAKDIEKKFKENNIELLSSKLENDTLKLILLDPTKIDKAVEVLKKEFPQLVVESSQDSITVRFTDWELNRIKTQTMKQAVETLRNRIDQFGTLSANIAQKGKDRILVEIPGVIDIERAKAIIGKTAQLELKEVVDSAYSKEELLKKYPNGIPDDLELLEGQEEVVNGQTVKEWFLVKKTPVITGAMLKDARTALDQGGNPAVNFELTSEGAEIFGEATQKMIGKRLAIVLDGKVMSAPVIRSRITSSGQITGRFSTEEANDLAVILRAGALPAPVSIVEESVIGPTLGKESIDKTLMAGIVSFTLVGLFMIYRYALSGFVAVIALVFNLMLLWVAMLLFDITLTLPGIAGIILNIGMGVDGNVVIFERIKEELHQGKTLRVSLEEGFKKGFQAIFDSHVTVIIAALALLEFGNAPLKGFAATLSIGTFINLFTAVFLTKMMLDFTIGGKKYLKYAI